MTEWSKVDLVGVGLNATDTVIPLSNYPARGSKVEYTTVSILPGGQVATTVVACQHWGLTPATSASSATTPPPTSIAKPSPTPGSTRASSPSPAAPAPSPSSSSTPAASAPSSAAATNASSSSPSDLEREWIVNARALHVDGYETAAATLAATWAREAGIPVIADLDEIYPGVEDLIDNVDYLIVSRDFPSRLIAEPDLEQALQQNAAPLRLPPRRRNPRPRRRPRLGRQAIPPAPAYRVPVVDTTGAGDIFHAGFIYGLLQDWPLDRQLDFACAAAALNCTSVGARGGIQTIETIERLMATGVRHPDTSLVSSPN